MNMFWAVILLPAGLALLLKGADWLVDGAVGIAARLKVSPLIVGLTVVAMGTSAPEVAASIAAALRNLGDTAVGNVYGSNIANLALIGGICALIRPIAVNRQAIRRDMPVMLAAAFLLWPILAPDRFLSRPEAAILIAGFIALLAAIILFSLKSDSHEKPDIIPAMPAPDKIPTTLPRNIIFIILGLAGLAIGADFTVRSAVFLGYKIGLSDAVIGLTIIAVGTSLPELVTCVVAAVRGHDDLSIGNLVGSNIFNTMLVIGAAGLVKPFAVSARLVGTDYWLMVAVSAAFAAIAILFRKISRPAGILLLAAYSAYILYLFTITRT